MRIRQVASRALAFGLPVAVLGAGIPALRTAIGSERSASLRPKASQQQALNTATLPTPAEVPAEIPPKPARITEDLFSVTLPPGWTGGEINNASRRDGGYDAKRVWRYTDDAGNFFVVAVDPDGSDYGYDQFWRYRVEDGSFRAAEVHSCDPGPDDPFCGRGDGKLDILITWVKDGSATLHGHAYYFLAGNSRDEAADKQPFEQILESIRPH